MPNKRIEFAPFGRRLANGDAVCSRLIRGVGLERVDMEAFRVTIASPPDRQRLVAEIFAGDTQVAEIKQEAERPLLELYPRPDGTPWNLDLVAFLEAVLTAKQRLLGA
jgi:hypothetical protein